jgi:hypothetical protein
MASSSVAASSISHLQEKISQSSFSSNWEIEESLSLQMMAWILRKRLKSDSDMSAKM